MKNLLNKFKHNPKHGKYSFLGLFYWNDKHEGVAYFLYVSLFISFAFSYTVSCIIGFILIGYLVMFDDELKKCGVID